ncbi:MAG: methylenetetrahydrofolate reductase [NAD(P)H] [bacterium]|nr:methylenetetrahydrofolate reductase [NAD(P)H] [bacterium]
MILTDDITTYHHLIIVSYSFIYYIAALQRRILEQALQRTIELSQLSDFFGASKPQVSFEFFPPKDPEGEELLWNTIKRLEPLAPDFVGVTYGALGSTRDLTHRTVRRLAQETALKPAAHLTCAGASRSEVDQVADNYWQAGVRHIVAMRGDPPKGSTSYIPHPDGYAHACDLVRGLKKLHDFQITVAAFPEKHPESPSFEFDMDVLKMKIDAGATQAITQYFFSVEDYFRLLDRAEKAHIEIPIIPGILPVSKAANLVNFSKTCGASVPSWLVKLFEYSDNNPDIRNLLAMHVAASQCLLLRKAGIDKFHFFTMNRYELTWAICRVLGLVVHEEFL